MKAKLLKTLRKTDASALKECLSVFLAKPADKFVSDMIRFIEKELGKRNIPIDIEEIRKLGKK